MFLGSGPGGSLRGATPPTPYSPYHRHSPLIHSLFPLAYLQALNGVEMMCVQVIMAHFQGATIDDIFGN